MTDQNPSPGGLEQLSARMPQASGLIIPPPIAIFLGGEILETTENSLTMRFPVREQYQNPFGYMQGGMLAALIDNTMGPLSFMVAPPSVTTQLTTTYIRPVTPQDEFVTVTATVKEKTRRQLFLSAEVKNASGKLLCFAEAIQMIVTE